MKRVLYLGLEVPDEWAKAHDVTHLPLIRVVPRSKSDPSIQEALEDLNDCTHVLFTSKTAVDIFFDYATENLNGISFAAVGAKTAARIESRGYTPSIIAKNETAEGLVAALSEHHLSDAYIFWPHSALSRPILKDWMDQQKIRNRTTIFYDTEPCFPPILPNLEAFDEIVFTSPSTVDAYILHFKLLPKDNIINCIGPITLQYLQHRSSIK